MKKQIVRLTEKDLHAIIENVVKKAKGLNESEVNEGFWDAAKSVGKQYGNRMKNAANKTMNKAKTAYNNVKTDVKNTMNQAGIDSAKADMQRAYNEFMKNAQSYVQKSGDIETINNMLNSAMYHQ